MSTPRDGWLGGDGGGPYEAPEGAMGGGQSESLEMPPQSQSRPRPTITQLAAIWPPYDARSGVIEMIDPVEVGTIEKVERTGYIVVQPIADKPPYTHVISTGTHDYLAAIEAAPAEETTL